MPNIDFPVPPPAGLNASHERDTIARIGPIVKAFRARTDFNFGDTSQ
jgi:hypothetical protein